VVLESGPEQLCAFLMELKIDAFLFHDVYVLVFNYNGPTILLVF
jgi:hypothetical protein